MEEIFGATPIHRTDGGSFFRLHQSTEPVEVFGVANCAVCCGRVAMAPPIPRIGVGFYFFVPPILEIGRGYFSKKKRLQRACSVESFKMNSI